MRETLHLCATARLAQTRRATPAARCAWRTPLALTLAQWFDALAEEAALTGIADLPMALDPFAEGLLWEQIIATALADDAALFDIPSMAAAAAEAQALTRVWHLRPAIAALADEARLFTGWQAAFERRCQKAGWIDAAGLQRRLIALIADGAFVLPERIEFHGFDRRTPLEDDLLTALAGRGVEVGEGPSVKPLSLDGRGVGEREVADARRLACADNTAECAAAVAWAARHLAARPGCRLGIVAPDLASVRDRLEFLLDDVLHPGAIRPDATESPRCFNFSLGRPLAGEPLVRCALELLQLGGGKGAKVEQARLSALLLADGWATASEADGRALLDAALRRDLPWLTTLTALLRLAKRLADDAPCRRSIAALTALADTLGGAPRRLRPGQWLGVFRTALAAAGWPGERPLSSREFQARRAFDDVLAAFARLEPLLGSLSQSEAVRRLGQLCRQRIFQPETRGQPALQILGLLESAGLEFDALWVMGMNDDQWPPRPRPNPLLPIESQRAAGSAHASAEVELDFARRIHARLLDAAPEVVFSYARAEGNRLLRPSPLLAGLPERTLATPQPSTIATRLAAASGQLEQLDDAAAPPLLAGETVSGGSWLLRAQAICPAWAFYQYRLGAEALAEPLEGLDPADRGSLAHGALEAFWRQTQDSAKLAALDETALAEAIAAAVAEAIRRFEAARQTQLPARFRQLEAARLEKLLSVWLGFEAGRPAPFTVVACEQRAEIEIEGIRIRLVVDRIDQLADGRQIIIDYKTGAAIDSKNWSSPRLTEPQLPIYAALVNDQVAAVVFARALPDQPAFTGVADEKDILPGVPGLGDARQKIFDPAKFSDWPAVITHWRACLHTVAGEIRDGWAGVVFADAKDLQYCPALPLLRLPERQRLLAVAVSGQRV